MRCNSSDVGELFAWPCPPRPYDGMWGRMSATCKPWQAVVGRCQSAVALMVESAGECRPQGAGWHGLWMMRKQMRPH